MPKMTVAPRIRSFICLNAHPVGCAANVEREIGVATKDAPGAGLKHALVIGASTGYGLSSLVSAVFGYGARGTAICLERPPQGERDRLGRLLQPRGRPAPGARARQGHRRHQRRRVLRRGEAGDAGARRGVGREAGPASSTAWPRPKRADERTGVTYNSALKPIGATFRSASINLGNDQIQQVEIAPATDAEIEATRKVMGGEDFVAWVQALLAADLLAKGCRAVAYSYIGPELTMPIYRSGTIGKAKEDLEVQTAALSATLRERIGGAAWVSVNKALVTQASAAIPVVPLYISALYKVMKEAGTHEGTAEQIARLFRDHLGPGRTPRDRRRRTASASTISRWIRPCRRGSSEMWKTVTTREPDVVDRLRRLQARLPRAVRLRGPGRRLRRAGRDRGRDRGVAVAV